MKNKKRGAVSSKAGNGASASGYGRTKTARETKSSQSVAPNGAAPDTAKRSYEIADYRLERPEFHVELVRDENGTRFIAHGGSDAPPPPIRESQYLKPKQCVELYRWMLLNRRMEQALENLYKQGKVVGGVYFGLGQEACSCASAYALERDDWFGPMIRNQGALLVRGFHPRDVMMQYMAKSGSPTHGKDGTSHFGDIVERNMVSPISMLGDLVPILTGVALGARLQGRNIACLTWIGDGGQSTGVTYEGFNFAAVQKLGMVLIVESNLWAYSTPTESQVAIRDLAERAIGYGVPGVIVDGTDACQVYDATHEACERARRGEGPTLIEAKMMRMKGHAIHDAAAYVPKEMFEFYKRRDPILRFEKFLLGKGWLSSQQNARLIENVEALLEKEREVAINSPMPKAEDAATGAYCDAGCHPIALKYGGVRVKTAPQSSAKPRTTEEPVHLR